MSKPQPAALALENREPLPKIASRCAVFAKTDLVHAQQEGYGLPAICDGLCHGVAKNINGLQRSPAWAERASVQSQCL